ncbi:HET-domain-containing protein [Stipitochalara longipes BDJ]|nr:HET-domain-containing protein [Stipitochalara longipes BDJ]
MHPIPENFVYTALNTEKHEIRLVHLQPRDSTEAIECSINTTNLDEKPSFEALSYEWGRPNTGMCQIQINGIAIQIRENLWAALYHLRKDSQPRTLWVDALCINQDDNRERNHQVGQMDRIYSEATSVVAWVGSKQSQYHNIDMDEGRLAIAFLHELSTCSVTEFPYRDSNPGPLSLARTPHTAKWDALATFCKRRYWSRLWIVQEIVLASKIIVQHGAFSVPWEFFSNVWQQLQISRPQLRFQNGLQHITSSVPFKLETRRRDRRWAIDDTGRRKVFTSLLVDLLDQFKDSECEDIKDKVFGLLSLTRECCRRAMPADYSMERKHICAILLEHHLAYHSNANKGGAMKVCQTILRALELEFGPDQGTEAHAVDRSLSDLRIGPKLSIDTVSTGRVQWVSSLWEDIRSPGHPELLNNQFLYFDFASEHYCSRKPSSQLILAPTEILVRRHRKGVCGSRIRTRISQINNWPEYYNITRLSSICRNEDFCKVKADCVEHSRRDDDAMPSNIVSFGTSTGLYGLATHNVHVGDRVYKIDGSLPGRLAFISKFGNSYQLTGKGLQKGWLANIDGSDLDFSILDEDTKQADSSRKRRVENRTEMQVDVVTLLYLSGYF